MEKYAEALEPQMISLVKLAKFMFMAYQTMSEFQLCLLYRLQGTATDI